jgi:lysophospholipase L1-like esterase
MRRVAAYVAMSLYCIAILLFLDFGYSSFIALGQSPRIPVEQYHHGLKANFSGYDRFYEILYPFFTNSLGLRDGAVRNIQPESATHRVLLLGDSYTEGVGMKFEDSFAGMLVEAGQRQADRPIEFLNAGVVSYSPAIYYAKTKYLLDIGLKFDEVILFSDISDVADEATGYFCIDEQPQYRQYCGAELPYSVGDTHNWYQRHFIITDKVRLLIKNMIRLTEGQGLVSAAKIYHDRDSWTLPNAASWVLPGADLNTQYQPLGIEGGIVTSKRNMQVLADLLAARHIALTIVVYPHPLQLAENDRDSRQIAIWREFCAANCRRFINLFPAFFAEVDMHSDWYRRLFLYGDVHLSAAGNKFMFQELARQLELGHDG